MTDVKNTIGQEIRQRRRSLDITQSELAEKLETFQSQVARWERGAVTPTARMQKLIISVLDKLEKKEFR